MHLLLALAARWSSTADKQLNGKISVVTSIVSHYDFNISHFRNVFERLIVATQSRTVAGNEDSGQRADQKNQAVAEVTLLFKTS